MDQIHGRIANEQKKALIKNSELSISNYKYLAMRERLKIKGICILATVVTKRANVVKHGFYTVLVVF